MSKLANLCLFSQLYRLSLTFFFWVFFFDVLFLQITGYRGTVVCPDSTDAVCLQDVESLPVQTSTQKQGSRAHDCY